MFPVGFASHGDVEETLRLGNAVEDFHGFQPQGRGESDSETYVIELVKPTVGVQHKKRLRVVFHLHLKV